MVHINYFSYSDRLKYTFTIDFVKESTYLLQPILGLLEITYNKITILFKKRNNKIIAYRF